jgi:hypothetical protein
LFKPYLFRPSSVLGVLGVHAIVSASTLVLEACFSLLAMFDVLFYLLHDFLCDRRGRAIRGRAGAVFEEIEPQFLGEEGKWIFPLCIFFLS